MGPDLLGVPETFPYKGKFRVYDEGWNHVGYSDIRQHPGQLPICFPEHWLPIECFFGRYLRGTPEQTIYELWCEEHPPELEGDYYA